MFNDIKLAFQSFKKNFADYLAVSFVFGMIVLVGIMLGQMVIGMFLASIIVIIPAIMSLKFCAFQSHSKDEVDYRSLKIGFLTFFKSIKVYFIVILKPLLIALLTGVFVYSFFMSFGISEASKTIPNIMEELSNYDTFTYAHEEMLQIASVKKILTIGSVVSVIVGYLVCFTLKLKRDFIPFIAFEMPINSKRAVSMNEKILKGNFIKFFISNLLVTLMFAIPIGAAYLTNVGMTSNEVFSSTTISLMSCVVFCVFAGPVAMIKQLHYSYAYKSYSKPFKEDFDSELKNVIKEIEELQKIIDKNDEK